MPVNTGAFGAASTCCVNTGEVLVVKLLSPPYTAVIECDPTESAAVVNVATPPESVPVPSVVAPSLKVTVPVAVPEPGATALTVAVSVMDSPEIDGVCEEFTAVVVEAWLTATVVTP